jgi:hypothetical protein
MILNPKEKALIGGWIFENGEIKEDASAKRIRLLISDLLQKVAVDSSGWDVLYRNPDDGTYWELTFPQSEEHGGGPPRLTFMRESEIKRKYESLF